jgi:hypothetical protein
MVTILSRIRVAKAATECEAKDFRRQYGSLTRSIVIWMRHAVWQSRDSGFQKSLSDSLLRLLIRAGLVQLLN